MEPGIRSPGSSSVYGTVDDPSSTDNPTVQRVAKSKIENAGRIRIAGYSFQIPGVTSVPRAIVSVCPSAINVNRPTVERIDEENFLGVDFLTLVENNPLRLYFAIGGFAATYCQYYT